MTRLPSGSVPVVYARGPYSTREEAEADLADTQTVWVATVFVSEVEDRDGWYICVLAKRVYDAGLSSPDL